METLRVLWSGMEGDAIGFSFLFRSVPHVSLSRPSRSNARAPKPCGV